ncbi:hypothetical protein LTS18_003109 [Coniosporium uncinatum]|uniref:Uncharacterized protein n=1 Tax=Coniosporium uncinatum TaxID=93489 RepID=A0ACC3DYC9_9PEZI|nr:hypothetical protein LTS18_003109 [Coniosporium uncinatum]
MTQSAVGQQTRQVIDTLFDYIEAQGHTDYIGEAVVGRFIPHSRDMPPMIAPDGNNVGIYSRETLGEQYLRGLGFTEKIYQLVGAHVMAKRYLTAVN